MGVNRGPSPIITDGLIFAIDAGNTRCYTSGSTTENDLIYDNQGSLENGLGYDPDGKGSWNFDGGDDEIDLGSITSSNPISLAGQTTVTIEIWCNPTGGAGDRWQRVIDKSDSGSGANGYSIWVSDQGSKVIGFGIDGVNVINNYTDSTLEFGEWNHIVFTKDGNTNKYYRNTSVKNTTTTAATIPSDTTNAKIGTWNHTTGREFKGKIASIRIYTKALTEAEITQNFNAQKSRFGL